MGTLGVQVGITIRQLTSAGDWMALFARPDLQDYQTVRVVAWALVTTGDGTEAFGALVPAHDVEGDTDGPDLIFAPSHPRFMGGYLAPGQLLSDRFVRERLARIRRQEGEEERWS